MTEVKLVACSVCNRVHLPKFSIDLKDNIHAREQYCCSEFCLIKHKWYGKANAVIYILNEKKELDYIQSIDIEVEKKD